VAPGVNDLAVADDGCTLTCQRARRDGDYIYVDWAEVVTAAGQAVFSMRDLVGYRIGKVPSRSEPLSPPTAEPRHRFPAPDRSADGNGWGEGPGGSRAPVTRPLAGKVALVTGSGRGLGKVIARQLARQGASVVVNSFHSRERGEATAAEIAAEG